MLRTVNIVSECRVLQQLSIVLSYALRWQGTPELSYNSNLRLKDGMFSPPYEDIFQLQIIKYMRKQWKPGPFLLPLSGQGMRLGNPVQLHVQSGP